MLDRIRTKLAPYRKAVTAAVGVALLLAANYAPGKYDAFLQAAIGFLTFFGVYEVPNEA